MELALYRSSAIVKVIEPLESSQLSQKLNGEDVVKLNFTSPTEIDLQIGDYIEVFGKQYTLNLVPDVVKKSSREYSYECIFESRLYDLIKPQFMNGISGEFFLNGDLTQFVTQIVANLNRIFTGWTVGTVDESATKNLQFSNENCLTVLQRLCTEFNVDFKLNNKEISVGTFEQIAVHSFSYGKGDGLYQLTRKTVDAKAVFTRLYPYGSTRNIPANYRNYSDRLKIAAGYIESNVNKYDIIEQSHNFDDIYPRFTGSVTTVTDEKTFRCSTINFDINAQMMPGLSAKVHFNTGQLAGYEFEIVSYTASTKQIVLKPLDQEKSVNNAGTLEAYTLPNTTLKPALGDSFVFIDIAMPQSYIDAAEAELLAAAQEYLAQNSEPRVVYGCDVDPIYMKQTGIILSIGDYINVKDTALGIDKDTRITSLTRSIYNEYIWKIELADQLAPQKITRMSADIENIKRLVIINRLNDISRANRNWKNSAELLSSIFDTDGFFDTTHIKPLSIATSMLSVGAKSGQFTMNCLIEPNYGANVNSCKLGAGTLVHFSIEESPRTWSISENNYTGLTAGTMYYIYARCTRASSNTGTLILDTIQRKVDSDATYYYFLVGVLHSVVSNVRGISLTYGQTSINGRFIKTGRIQNGDGSTFFDLDSGEFQGKFTFRSGKTDTQLESEISTAQSDADYAQTVADAALTNAAQAQADATTALAGITGVIGDNVLSAIEKSGERLRWNTSLSEKSGIDSQADTFGISRTAYDNAFQALANYLNGGSAWSDGAPLWLNDANLTTNTTIVGGTYRSTWENFLNSKTALLNSIAAKAKQLADAAQSDADYASTVADSALTNAASAQSAASSAQTAATNALNTANTVNALVTDMANDDKVTPSEKTLLKKEFDSIQSEVTKNDIQADAFGVSRTAYDNTFVSLNGFIGNNLNVLTDTWDLGTGGGADLRSAFNAYTDARTDLMNAIASKAKAIADNKRRNFTFGVPTTPYDVGDSWEDGVDRLTCVTARASGSFNPSDWAKRVNYDSTQVSIDNGIVSAGSFRVKDSNNVEWGGMRGATGTTGTEVFIWGGASMANRSTAPLRFYHDGRGHMAGWDVEKDNTHSWYYFAKDTGTDATSAGMSPSDYPFYAGATYANRASAKAWIKNNGDAYFESVTVKSSGDGKRVEISNIDNNFIAYTDEDGRYCKIDDNINSRGAGFGAFRTNYYARLGHNLLDMANNSNNNFFSVDTSGYVLSIYMKNLPDVTALSGFHPVLFNPTTGQIGWHNP